MTDDSPVVHINFTITETGSYQLSTFYKNFGQTYQVAKLYRNDGTLIASNWRSAPSLQTGDYYIEYTSSSHSGIFVLIIPKIIKR